MRSRTLAATGAVLAAAAAGALAQPAAAAPTSGVPWTVSFGTATASGTRWTESAGGMGLYSTLVLDGGLKNTGSGCYSVWSQWTFDMAPVPAHKEVTQCGPGAVPVSVQQQGYSPTTTGRVYICRGDRDMTDCSAPTDVTWWPVGG